MAAKLPKLLRSFDALRHRRLPDLGEREMLALEALWQGGQASAQQVLANMAGAEISLSTVQSTLERLHRKRLVSRSKIGRAYHYSAVLSRSQLISGLMRDMAEDLAAGDLAPMISGFVNYISAQSPELADELTRALGLDDPGHTASDDGHD